MALRLTLISSKTLFLTKSRKAFRHPGTHRSITTAMSMQHPEPEVIGPTNAPHKSTFIMLHGLGDSAAGWADVAYMLGASLPNTRFIFPNAAVMPVTLNGGLTMPAWYDIAELASINRQEDETGLQQSSAYIQELVKTELSSNPGLKSNKIVVGGFSQGGACALMSLRWPDIQLGGCVGLSTYVPLSTKKPLISDVNKQTPIFLGHGDVDQVVAYEFGKKSAAELGAETESRVILKTYQGMGHSACNEEFADLTEFLSDILN
jgi:predicted esterase